MNIYQILKTTLYEKVVLSLLKRSVLSISEALNCLSEIESETKSSNNDNNFLIMVKQKGRDTTNQSKSGPGGNKVA